MGLEVARYVVDHIVCTQHEDFVVFLGVVEEFKQVMVTEVIVALVDVKSIHKLGSPKIAAFFLGLFTTKGVTTNNFKPFGKY